MIWFRPGVLMHPGTNFMIMCLKAARKEISIPFIDWEGKRIDKYPMSESYEIRYLSTA